jgi:hypothetical protein
MSDTGNSVIEHREDIIVDRPIPRDMLRSVEEGVLVTCTDTHCDWQGLFPDADLAATAVERHYDHEKRSGQYHYGSRTYLAVELLNQGTACSLDTSKLGLSVEEQRFNTPSGEVRRAEFPRTTGNVSELVQRGDQISLPPDRRHKVCRVSETRSSGLPTWTVVYVDEDTDLTDANRSDYYWQNELVARDGDVHLSFGLDPLAAPAFEVVGEIDHQADFSEFVARSDGGRPRSIDTSIDQEGSR